MPRPIPPKKNTAKQDHEFRMAREEGLRKTEDRRIERNRIIGGVLGMGLLWLCIRELGGERTIVEVSISYGATAISSFVLGVFSRKWYVKLEEKAVTSLNRPISEGTEVAQVSATVETVRTVEIAAETKGGRVQ